MFITNFKIRKESLLGLGNYQSSHLMQQERVADTLALGGLTQVDLEDGVFTSTQEGQR